MKNMYHLKCCQSILRITLLISLLLFFHGCAIKLVADYDAEITKEIINLSKQVNRFYGILLEKNESKRNYDLFKEKYITIEVNLRALIIQNRARPLNEESISIAETTLEKWLKYKEKHKTNNNYKSSLAGNHRVRFNRLFTAMLVAEEAKKSKY